MLTGHNTLAKLKLDFRVLVTLQWPSIIPSLYSIKTNFLPVSPSTCMLDNYIFIVCTATMCASAIAGVAQAFCCHRRHVVPIAFCVSQTLQCCDNTGENKVRKDSSCLTVS